MANYGGVQAQDVVLSVLAATASDAGVQLGLNWLNDRYKQFAARARVRQNRHYGTINAPAPITAGTVTVTQGSATAVLSTPLTASAVGWQIRISVQWYFIVAQAGDNVTLTLDTPYSEVAGVGGGASFTLVKRYLPVVDPATRWVSSVIHQRRRKRLDYKPFETLQSMYPGRTLVASLPWCWTEASRFIETLDISPTLGTLGQKFIEVYPPSNIMETYTYIYWTIPSKFAATDTFPPEIDEYVLREGVLIDVYRYKKMQAAAKENVELAGLYGNFEARQETLWERKIQEAMVTDALFHNDVPVELTLFTDAGEYSGDITNAHQWIMSEWSQ